MCCYKQFARVRSLCYSILPQRGHFCFQVCWSRKSTATITVVVVIRLGAIAHTVFVCAILCIIAEGWAVCASSVPRLPVCAAHTKCHRFVCILQFCIVSLCAPVFVVLLYALHYTVLAVQCKHFCNLFCCCYACNVLCFVLYTCALHYVLLLCKKCLHYLFNAV